MHFLALFFSDVHTAVFRQTCLYSALFCDMLLCDWDGQKFGSHKLVWPLIDVNATFHFISPLWMCYFALT